MNFFVIIKVEYEFIVQYLIPKDPWYVKAENRNKTMADKSIIDRKKFEVHYFVFDYPNQPLTEQVSL